MRDKISRLFRHRAVSRGYGVLLGLFAAFMVYHAAAVYWVKITCEFYQRPLYQSLLFAYYVIAISASVATLLGLIGWAVLGRWKRVLLFLALLVGGFFIGFRVFGDAAFYCFGEALVEMLRSIVGPLLQRAQPPP